MESEMNVEYALDRKSVDVKVDINNSISSMDMLYGVNQNVVGALSNSQLDNASANQTVNGNFTVNGTIYVMENGICQGLIGDLEGNV